MSSRQLNSNRRKTTSFNDLSNVTEIPVQECLQRYGCQPIRTAVTQNALLEIYSSFDEISSTYSELAMPMLDIWEEEFSHCKDSDISANVRFGHRNRFSEQHRGKDAKSYLQISKEYVNFVFAKYSNDLRSIPPLYDLFETVMRIDLEARQIFTNKLIELLDFEQLGSIMDTSSGFPQLAINHRILRYGAVKNQLSTSPHIDKSVATLVWMSDDEPSKECLVVGAANAGEFDLDTLVRLQRPATCETWPGSYTLFMAGNSLQNLGTQISGTPHAVLPHNSGWRHSLISFCNLPYSNTENTKSNIVPKENIGREKLSNFLSNRLAS